MFVCAQLNQALAGKFNAHVHVEYEWCLQHEDLDESDEDLDEKVRRVGLKESRWKKEIIQSLMKKSHQSQFFFSEELTFIKSC